MPKAPTAMSQLNLRLPEAERFRLEAIAYDEALAADLTESTDDLNFSAWVRRVLNDYAVEYLGGSTDRDHPVLKRYREARVRDAEARVEALRNHP